MLTSVDSLFYVAFLGQIFLISWYFPEKILRRMKYVLKTYPPSQYPRLYPKPIEYYQTGQWAFRLVNRIIIVAGFVILFVMLFVVDHNSFADDGYISEFWPAAYGAVQFLPLMFLEFSECNQFRMMRKANVSTTRTADLSRRGLFGFVSPRLFASAILLIVATLLFDLYVLDFEIRWGRDAVQRAMVLIVTNLLLVVVGVWNLRGRKMNPHQARDDRTRQITTALHSLLYVSMAMSVFFMTQTADDLYDLDFLDATLMSLYFQLIVVLSLGHVLRSLSLENVNFDVYRDNGEAIT
jgi:uncharacterized membrane protein